MTILYLVSVIILWIEMVVCRKSEQKQNLMIWGILSIAMVLCVQVLCGGIIGKLGIPVSCGSVGIFNLVISLFLALWIVKKGRQTYEIKILDVVSILLILGIIMLFSLSKYGRHLDVIDYISPDASSHAASAMTVALEHRIPTNLYFTSLNTGLMMQAYQALTGAGRFDLYRVFIWCEIVYTALAALLFWALIRQRCGENRWQRFVPLLLAPFYWAGYPLYSTLFGFSYLGIAVCLFEVLLLLLDLYFHDRIRTILFVIGMNLALYGIFVSYTLFVPAAFFGVFAALTLKMSREKSRKLVSVENILMMLKVFLVPTVLGLLYSFSNVEALAPGTGGIRNEGACYNDIYSNFILLIPFMILGIYFLVSRKEGGYLLPMAAVQAVLMAVMMTGLMTGRVSVYYYTKMNSVCWLLAWALVAESILGMARHCKWAILFPFFFYGVVFMGKYWDTWQEKANPLAGRVEVWNFCDLIMINNTYFNFDTYMTPETMELYRYAADHCAPGEAAGVDLERECGWFRTLTGQENTYTYTGKEEFLEEVEKKGFSYICAGYGKPYETYKEFLDLQEVVMENGAGKILKVVVKPSEMRSGEIPGSP